MKVKVTKCPDGELWYSKYIGEIIEVVECYEYNSDDHRVVDWQRYDDEPETVGLFIRRQDCEILSKTCEEVTMTETKEFKVGDEVKVVALNDHGYPAPKRTIGMLGKIVGHGYVKGFEVYLEDEGEPWFYDSDELELVEPKELVLTKSEALKAAIDGAEVTNELCINECARISWNGKVFMLIYDRSGYKDQADGVLHAKQWKLWTPPTPKPKFSIGQTVIDEDGDTVVIKSVDFKDGRFEYEATYEMSVQYVESQLSEVTQ